MGQRGSITAKFLTAIALCLGVLVGVGLAAFSFVNQSACTGTKKTCIFTYTPTAGNFMIIAMGWTGGNVAPTSVTETNVTWTQLATRNTAASGCDTYYVTNIPASPGGTITFNFNTNATSAGILAEFSGAATTNVLDGANGSDINVGASRMQPTSFTSTHTHDLIFGMGDYNSTTAPNSNPTGFTPLTRGTNTNSIVAAYQIVTSAGTWQPAWTLAASQSWCSIGQAFKDPSVDSIPNEIISIINQSIMRAATWSLAFFRQPAVLSLCRRRLSPLEIGRIYRDTKAHQAQIGKDFINLLLDSDPVVVQHLVIKVQA